MSLVLLDDREGLIRGSPSFHSLNALLRDEPIVLHQSLSALSSEADLAPLRNVKFALAVRERTKFDHATLAKLPSLELLLQTGGHAYHVDQAALRDRGIVTALGRRAQRVMAAVPELTLLLMLASMRRLGEAASAMSATSTGWPTLVGRTLSGRQLGILGLGRHGSAVARLATTFGMSVVAWDRRESSVSSASGSGIPLLPLDELLSTCDVVSIHLRLSPESKGLLDAAHLQRMKPRSILINTARGAIVDEDALIAALTNGPLAAAGLDVFTDEPLRADSPLRGLPNAILTPHVGWTTEEVFDEFATIASEQLRDYLSQQGLSASELLDSTVVLREGAAGRIRLS